MGDVYGHGGFLARVSHRTLIVRRAEICPQPAFEFRDKYLQKRSRLLTMTSRHRYPSKQQEKEMKSTTSLLCVLTALAISILGAADAVYGQASGGVYDGFEGWTMETVDSKIATPARNTNTHVGEHVKAGAGASVKLKGINEEEARLEVARGGDIKRITLGPGNAKVVELGDRRYLVINLLVDPDEAWIRLVVVTFRKS